MASIVLTLILNVLCFSLALHFVLPEPIGDRGQFQTAGLVANADLHYNNCFVLSLD